MRKSYVDVIYEITPWEKVVEKCTYLLRETEYHEMKKIKANLEIGRYVDEIRKSAEYGEGAVQKLAVELTARTGRTVYPQRLYEACAVYQTVRTMDKVEEIMRKRGEEISWNWLVKYATRKAENEKDRKLREEKLHGRFARIENRLESAVEDLAGFKIEKLSEDEKETLKGVALSALQTIETVIRSVDNTNSNKDSNDRLSSEVTEKNRILIEAIDHDEITSTDTNRETLEIHDLGGGDIDTSVVVSRETHREIHFGRISTADVVRIISERNKRLAREYLELLVLEKRGINSPVE